MPVVKVSDYVKGKLEELKRRNGHTSIDSVIRGLLIVYERFKK